MFCPKCGVELPDGSAFCAACGAQLTEAEAPQQAAPAEQPVQQPVEQPVQQPVEQPVQQPVQQPQAAPVQLDVKVPPLAILIKLGVALLAFIFGFVGWLKVSAWGYSQSFSIFEGHMFDLNFFCGLAKLLMIISIPVFIVFVVSQFIDLGKYVKLPFDIKKMSGLAYFGIFAASLVLTLLGAIFESYVHPGFGWYISLILGAAGLALSLKPELLDKIVKK